jgi:N-acetyl-gamma-glutamyl-phosphate reductase
MDVGKKISVAVLGVNGYVGLELSKLLLAHPYAQLVAVFGRASEFHLEYEISSAQANQVPYFSMEGFSAFLENQPKIPGGCKTVFLATPAETSVEIAPEILKKGIQVIDMSGAFRLTSARYGLMPWAKELELNEDTNSHSNEELTEVLNDVLLVANPGCYATSIQMALVPLLKSHFISAKNLVIDAKSGTTGAGKTAQAQTLFSEVDGDCRPYRVGVHPHMEEMITHLKQWTGQTVDFHFTTHLLPVRRGILASIYAEIDPSLWHLSNAAVLEKLDSVWFQAYQNYPLVKWGRIGVSEFQDRSLLSLRRVIGTGRTHLGYTVIGKKLYLFSCIDNLLKGAASQAIENWNCIHGFSLVTGLEHYEELV